MKHPTPAIVTRSAARRVPPIALLLFCVTYALSGFIGRDAWKSADMTAFGFMWELAQGQSDWWAPTLLGTQPSQPALLPYWLGAWALQFSPAWIAPDFAVRIPFMALLGLALVATWHASYYLARNPLAQPVAFAFGGEAEPRDYARALGDGGLLAFIACLGLAQLSHETTPELTQLACAALFFYGMSALPYRKLWPALIGMAGLSGLALSGAPSVAVLLGLGSAALHATSHRTSPRYTGWESLGIAAFSLGLGAVCAALHLTAWKIELPHAYWADWNGYAQLLIWFTWPVWPLVLITLWRWRRQLLSRYLSHHLALPLWFVLVSGTAAITTNASDRALLIGLPAMAALAAFALPTLKRQVSAVIDWFTLLFFSGCGFTIWVVWIAMQTGFPPQPAANVERLAPGFAPTFSWLTLAIAILATLAWAWLVKWRVGRHRTAIWKSLVLPAGGAALCWLLLMSLWMPLLNYTQSYGPLVQQTVARLDADQCVHADRISQAQIAAFQYYGRLSMHPLNSPTRCEWLLVEPDAKHQPPHHIPRKHWKSVAVIHHPADENENVLLMRRIQ